MRTSAHFWTRPGIANCDRAYNSTGRWLAAQAAAMASVRASLPRRRIFRVPLSFVASVVGFVDEFGSLTWPSGFRGVAGRDGRDGWGQPSSRGGWAGGTAILARERRAGRDASPGRKGERRA